MQQFSNIDQRAENLILGGQVSHEMFTDWRFITSAQWVSNKREISDLKKSRSIRQFIFLLYLKPQTRRNLS